MRFLPSEEQAALRDAARAFLAGQPGPHTLAEQGAAYDPAVWAAIVEQQGWQAIQVPEAAGGWGFGLVEAALVFEEAGRALTPSPLFGTCALATSALLLLGDAAQQAAHLGAIAAGGTATAALDAGLRATEVEGGWRLEGAAERVVDGDSADLLVLGADAGVFVVPRALCAVERVPSLDPTRPLARVTVAVELPAEARLAGRDVEAASLRAAVLLAAEQVGGAEAMLDLTVEHAKARVQYGRPIGSFQAVQHTCADMLVAVESARSATWYAAAAWDAGLPDAALAARTAKAMASDACFRVAGAAIQVHGGIGFSWEHVAHLHFKRARAGLVLLGAPAAHRARVAAALVAGEAPWT
jgi:alkylation response protein AidB-like acyl-CoA dehydrogenase